MYNIDTIQSFDIPRLMVVWEASVRATHDFVNEHQIMVLKNLIEQHQLFENPNIFCVRNKNFEVDGFAVVTGNSLDMLFLHPSAIGKGIGKALIQYAINFKGATRVDVNEQNEHATGFYKHFGFEVICRSTTDDYGQPFPILHMQLKNNG